MRFKYVVFAMLAFGPSAKGEPVLVQGVGHNDCAEFTKASAANSAARDQYLNWAQGFLSSMNMSFQGSHELQKSKDLGGDPDAEEAYIRAYCNAHPTDSFSAALIDFFGQLPEVATRWVR